MTRRRSRTEPLPVRKTGPATRTWPGRLAVEALEDRVAPVVGATAIPGRVLPLTGYDGVIKLNDPRAGGGTALCSGSLLFTGRHILTAAHCPDGNLDGAPDDGTHRVTFEMLGAPTIEMDVVQDSQNGQKPITISPDWTGKPNSPGDIAVMTLPAVAPFGAERFAVYRNTDEVGQNFTMVGYGDTGIGGVDNTTVPPTPGGARPGTGGVKRLGMNTFGATDRQNRVLQADFDDGTAANDTLDDGLGLGAAEAALAPGDSGGPAFIGDAIAGVDSFVTGRSAFGSQSGFTRVSSYANWIDRTVAGRYDLVLDMDYQVLGVNGREDALTVTARRNGANIELVVSATDPANFDHQDDDLLGVYYSDRADRIKSLTILGTEDDDETFRIQGFLGISTVSVDGRGGFNKLVVDNQDSPQGASYTIDADAVSIANQTRVSYTDVSTLELRAGSGSDNVNVRGTSNSVVTHVYAGPGPDIINVGNTSDLLNGINVIVHGEDGNDTLNVSNTGTGRGGTETYDLTDRTFRTASTGRVVTYDTIEDFELDTGGFRDIVNVAGTPPGTTSINTDGGPDQITVTGENGRLALNGGGGGDTFTFRNANPSAAIDGGAEDDTLEVVQTTAFASRVQLSSVEEIKIIGGTFAVDADVATKDVQVVSGSLVPLDRTLKAPAGVNVQPFGIVAGAGTIVGDVANAGAVYPGGNGEVGRLTVRGNYTQTATGKLFIDLQGPAIGTQSDNLDVAGNVGLVGVLTVNPLASFGGDSFEIVTNRGPNAVAGTFAGLAEGAIVRAGDRRFRISYVAGDGNDVVLSLFVPVASATSVTGAPSPSVFGQPVVFTSTVTPANTGPGVPTGLVQFQLDGVDFGAPVPVVDGRASSPGIATLPAGPHAVFALYGGDDYFAPSSGTFTATVNPAATTTAVSSDLPASVFGQTVTFTATVAPVAPGAGTPTGMVAFKSRSPDGSIVVTLGTAPVDSGGRAVFTKNNLVPAPHTVFAVYLGDANFADSTSADITHYVAKADTKTTLSASATTVPAGQGVNFFVSLSVVPPGAPVAPATGTISLYDTFEGVKTLLAVLTIGGPPVQFPALTTVGTHQITAVYSGDSDYNESTSDPLTLTVVPAGP